MAKKAINRFWKLQHLAIVRGCSALATKYNPSEKSHPIIINLYIDLLCDDLEQTGKVDWAELEKYKEI